MSYQVTIQPSGHHFHVQANEPILNAAIEAGVNLPYGCRNGACGACKGKVVSGDVTHLNHQGTALTSAEIEAGMALFCCATPLTDLVIESREVAGDAIRPRILPVRVEKMEKRSHDVMALFLKLPSNERLQFMAGQYIEFIMKDGKRRAFSLANAPHDDQFLELHLRLIPGGAFTEYVFNEMQEKAILRIEAPFGSFYLRENSQKPMVMVAGGTGFAPIKGIIEHLIHQNIQREVRLYWGAKTLEDLYMLDLPKNWASMMPNIQFVPVLSEPLPSDAWQGRVGLVHQAVLDDFNDLSAYEVYCCGAPGMVEAALKDFQAQGLPADAFFSDAFTYANPAANVTP
jgi:CDP-4-dehydro-6-deoxyglucose reductase, E3